MSEQEKEEGSNEEKMIMYYKLKQDYMEERKKIINQLNKQTKFIEMTNEKKRIELKRKIKRNIPSKTCLCNNLLKELLTSLEIINYISN